MTETIIKNLKPSASSNQDTVPPVMQSQDFCELKITGADGATAAGYDAYVYEFLAYGSALRALFTIADNTPDCALVNGHAAALHMAFEGAEGWVSAQPYLERMRTARNGNTLTGREALFCDAIEAWSRRDFHRTLAILDTLTVRWPADLCAIKWGQYHAFNLGDQAALLRFGQRAIIVHKDTPYAHGLIAFALEQNHRLDEAHEEGKRAVKIASGDAWAHHAVAHVLETRHQVDQGIAWMEKCRDSWDKKGIFIRDHNWWHTALFYLAADDHQKVLEIFDERLWGAWPEFPQEQIGAVSMLWRLEMIGQSAQDRWSPIVDQVRVRAGEHILPFHDLHYAYALARAGNDDESNFFLKSLEQYSKSCRDEAYTNWHDICLPLAKAVTAFANDDYNTTIDLMAPVLPELSRIGGSHAQRQVFLDTYETARLKSAQI